MTAVTHQLIALLGALFMLIIHPHIVGLTLGVLSIMAVMIGALTPDLDQPTANLWEHMLGAKSLGRVFRLFSGGHRHLTHSLLGIIGIGYGLHWLVLHLVNTHYIAASLLIWTAYMIGYISHPIADTFTDHGVPWLWPLGWQLKLPPGPSVLRITTSSFVEMVLLRGILVLAIFVLLNSYWSVFVRYFS